MEHLQIDFSLHKRQGRNVPKKAKKREADGFPIFPRMRGIQCGYWWLIDTNPMCLSGTSTNSSRPSSLR